MEMEMEKLGCLTHLFVTLFLASFAGVVSMPALTDVTMEALCPGKDECSLAIYLSGFQQAISGIGSVLMTPLIGNLSDIYGRKSLLTLPLTLNILPLVVLAYSRETSFFYAYYVLRTLASMISEGAIHCLSLAYVADKISEGKRASAFGILAGVSSAAFVCGTLSARFLSTAQTFQAAAFSAMAAAAYMRIFLQEITRKTDASIQPLLKSDPSSSSDDDMTKKVQIFKKIPTFHNIKSLLGSSKTFSQITVMVLFNSLAEGGLQASLMYFLKAEFHFSKNQFADLMLIVGIAGMVSQLVLMPMLLSVTGEEWLLRLGLLVASTNMILNSVAWDVWVIYAVAGLSVFVVFTNPCMRSIASKQVGESEQGKAQGCISGIGSLANIISPLVFSPLTATFLSDKAPFHFPGFSLLCIALCMAMAFLQSLMIRATPKISSNMVA
ncbi:hippocampus abundant transcript 1 protein-like [Chenopodium quinoa]|uniref:hippocampus abundant transcript 1 protein-like n=1 Tax=Chenopodium quinoa TaxID=63459 RepID=UPI000B76EC90|nr:hippocampus abundant transcript 1 protein-like [Chenopodium quinoa]